MKRPDNRLDSIIPSTIFLKASLRLASLHADVIFPCDKTGSLFPSVSAITWLETIRAGMPSSGLYILLSSSRPVLGAPKVIANEGRTSSRFSSILYRFHRARISHSLFSFFSYRQDQIAPLVLGAYLWALFHEARDSAFFLFISSTSYFSSSSSFFPLALSFPSWNLCSYGGHKFLSACTRA